MVVDTTSHWHDFLAMKINEEGDIIWYQTYGSKYYEICDDVMAHSSGDFFLIGNNQTTFPYYNLETLVVQVNAEGQVADVEESKKTISFKDVLLYPNPTGDLLNVWLTPTPILQTSWMLMDGEGRLVDRGAGQDEGFSK